MIVKVDVSAKGTFEIYLDDKKLAYSSRDLYGRMDNIEIRLYANKHYQTKLISIESVACS